MEDDFLRKIEELAEREGHFDKAAYLFLFDALEYTVKKLKKTTLSETERHVSGRDLLYGLSEYGMDQYGPLTFSVFKHWGLRTTRDIGEMVFSLVAANLMRKTAEDCIDDFVDVYEFAEEFDWKKRRTSFKRLS